MTEIEEIYISEFRSDALRNGKAETLIMIGVRSMFRIRNHTLKKSMGMICYTDNASRKQVKM